MVWISLLLLISSAYSKELPKFLTKHPIDSLRYITQDGRYAYLQKKPGVLGMVSSFRSVDFISDSSLSDFIVKDSRFKKRLIIETIPQAQTDLSMFKNHKISTVDWGKTSLREIGSGSAARLHLDDDWISYYDASERLITVQNILTEKKYQIRLSPKVSPFFTPEVEMVDPETVVYTDINDKGYAGFIQYNLLTQKSNVLYKSPQIATRLELCQDKGYLAIGEFPYDDIARNSIIMQIKLTGSTNLAGFSTIYSSSDSDIGNMVCSEKNIFFIKTLIHNRKINFKQTEAVKLDLKTTQVQTISEIGSASQLISMDGRVLIPFRGEYQVVEGTSNLTDDKLKAPTSNTSEELLLEP